MVRISIPNEGLFHVLYKWSDITLEEGIELATIASRFPTEWVDAQRERLKGNEEKALKLEADLSNIIKIETIPAIYGDIIQILSTIPERLIKSMTAYERGHIVENILCHTIMGFVLFPYTYKQRDIESFDLDGETYYLPTSKRMLEKEVPMESATAVEFAESSDLLSAGSELEAGAYTYLPTVIAILCRPKGEAYNEETVLKRVDKFKGMRMSDVWEVFFCLEERWNLSKKVDLKSLSAHLRNIVEKAVSTDGMQA